MLQHQDEACHPALRTLVQLGRGFHGDGLSPCGCDRDDLVARDGQLAAGHVAHQPRGPEPCERGRRLRSTGHDHAASLRHLREAGLERSRKRTFHGNRLKVVEHERERMRCSREELPEEDARERWHIVAVLRRERGQLVRPRTEYLPGGVAEVVEETGRIGVVGVDLVPEGLQAARLQVRGGQRCLAGSGRSGDPRDRPARRPVEGSEQRFPVDGGAHDRLRRLRVCGAGAPRVDHLILSFRRQSSHAHRVIP